MLSMDKITAIFCLAYDAAYTDYDIEMGNADKCKIQQSRNLVYLDFHSMTATN